MSALHSITGEANPECPHHDADGLVCEAHPDRPWTLETGEDCCGAPGMFCACTRWPCGAVGSNCECGPDVDHAGVMRAYREDP